MIDITTVRCPISRHEDPEAASQWVGLVALYTDHGEDNMMERGRIEVNLENAQAFADEAAELRAAARGFGANEVIQDALYSQAAALDLHARFIRAIADAAGVDA